MNRVKRNQILTANSLKALSDDVGEIVAPSLAGLMIIRFGAESPFALAGIGFLCATGFILTTRPRTHLNDSGAKNSLVKEISEGVRYAISNRLVLALLIIAATAVFGTAVIPLLPVYGRDVLGAGPSGYGLLAASLAAGFLAGIHPDDGVGRPEKESAVVLRHSRHLGHLRRRLRFLQDTSSLRHNLVHHGSWRVHVCNAADYSDSAADGK